MILVMPELFSHTQPPISHPHLDLQYHVIYRAYSKAEAKLTGGGGGVAYLVCVRLIV